jgi:zinc transporter 9
MLARRLLRSSDALKLVYRRSLNNTVRSFGIGGSGISFPGQKADRGHSETLKTLRTQSDDFRSRRKELHRSWSVQEALSALEVDNLSGDNGQGQQLDPEKMKAQRIRAAHVLFKALVDEARTAMATSRQTRSFSTDSSSKPPKNKDEETPSKMEPDFADYLTGKEDLQEVKKDQQEANEEPIAQFKLPDSIPTQPGESEADVEAYRCIRSQQITDLEKARAKTAANVRRALAGNLVICVAKLGAWMSSGSSSMLSELVHSIVDCGNQSLLLVGLRDSENVADRKHPYGYGKSIYFWALVSALGTFFLGAGVSMTHAVGELMNPSLQDITWEVWGVLGLSLTVDGYVFGRTIAEVAETKPKDKTMWAHVSKLRDPATLAILLEDGAACLGVIMALAGISAAHVSGMPVFDGMAGVGISALLASMGLVLVRVNHRFLLGQAVDRDITEGIEKILRSQRSIDNVQSVQSQWTSSETFSYKAEVDFDGTFLAAKLMPRYQQEFLQVKDTLDQDLRVLLSWYAEDIIRTVEREVRHSEAEIRKVYPGAEYIELEPMSKDSDRFAIDDGMEAQLRRIELEALNRYLKSLYQSYDTKPDEDKSGKK